MPMASNKKNNGRAIRV